jgi:hypothetical protein
LVGEWGAMPGRGRPSTCSAATGTRAPPPATILAPMLALFLLLSCPYPSNGAPPADKGDNAGLRRARGGAANAAALSIPVDEVARPPAGAEWIGAKAATGATAMASMARSQNLSILPRMREQRWNWIASLALPGSVAVALEFAPFVVKPGLHFRWRKQNSPAESRNSKAVLKAEISKSAGNRTRNATILWRGRNRDWKEGLDGVGPRIHPFWSNSQLTPQTKESYAQTQAQISSARMADVNIDQH